MLVHGKLACVVLIAAMAPLAAQGALLHGFESLDGVSFDTVNGITGALGTVGVTQGSSSLQVNTNKKPPDAQHPDGDNWVLCATVNGSILTALKNHKDTYGSAVLKVDFTAPTNPTAWWFQFYMGFQGEGQGWTQSGMLLDSGSPVPTTTISWDVTSLINNNIPANPSWGQVVFISNTSGPHTFYVDNLRIESIPEPASLSLLGLAGGALLLGRKRRA